MIFVISPANPKVEKKGGFSWTENLKDLATICKKEEYQSMFRLERKKSLGLGL